MSSSRSRSCLACIFPLLLSLSLSGQKARFIIPHSYGKYWPSEMAWKHSSNFAVSPRLIDYLLDRPRVQSAEAVEDSLLRWSVFLYSEKAAEAQRPALLNWVQLLEEQDWEWQVISPWLGAPPEVFSQWMNQVPSGRQRLLRLKEIGQLYQRLEQSLQCRQDQLARSALRYLQSGSDKPMLQALKRRYESGGGAAAAHDYALALDYVGHPEKVGPLYRIAIGKAPDSSRFLQSFGRHLAQEGRFQEARLMYNRAAAPDSVIAESYRLEGYTLLSREQPGFSSENAPSFLSQARHGHGLDRLKQALAIEERQWKKVDPRRMNRYWEMGQLCKSLALNQAAINYLERALKQCRRYYGRRNPYIPGLLDDLASTYASFQQATYAKKLYQRALRKDERLFKRGKPYPGLAVRYNNIGSIYLQQGDRNKAKESFLAAKKIMPRFFRAGHPFLKTIDQNLSNVYLYQGMAAYRNGDYRNARNIWQRGLEIELEDWPVRQGFLNNIGAAFKKLGRCDSALVYLDRALDIAGAPAEPPADLEFDYRTPEGFHLDRTYFHRADCLLQQGHKALASRIAGRLKRWAKLNKEARLLEDLRRTGFP